MRPRGRLSTERPGLSVRIVGGTEEGEGEVEAQSGVDTESLGPSSLKRTALLLLHRSWPYLRPPGPCICILAAVVLTCGLYFPYSEAAPEFEFGEFLPLNWSPTPDPGRWNRQTLEPGHDWATPEGTARFAARMMEDLDRLHFKAVNVSRRSAPWILSDVGIGTYRGDADDTTDRMVESAIGQSIEAGWNVIDTAINYRQQKSERSVGRALASLLAYGMIRRDEIVVATKGGFLPGDGDARDPPHAKQRWLKELKQHPDFAPSMVLGAKHCIAPLCLSHSLNASLANLQLSTVDVYYLHNAAEIQLPELGIEVLQERLLIAFMFLERERVAGRIQWYGMATWSAFRTASSEHNPKALHLNLQEVLGIASHAYMRLHGGTYAGAQEHHGFRFMQLPLNFGMTEALEEPWQTVDGRAMSFLDAAKILGVTVMSSKSIGSVPKQPIDHPNDCNLFDSHIQESSDGDEVPLEIRRAMVKNRGVRRLQWTRSTPGVSVALVGHKTSEHIKANVLVGKIPRFTKQIHQLLLEECV